MRQVQLDAYGGPEVLHVVEVPDLRPGPVRSWFEQRQPASPSSRRNSGPDGRHAAEDFDLAKAAIFDVDGTLLDSVDLHALGILRDRAILPKRR